MPGSNVGRSRFKGVEVEAEYGAGGFFARSNLAIIDGKDRLNDVYLNAVPANEYRLTLGYADPVWGLPGGWTGEFAEKQTKVSNVALATPGFAAQNLSFAFKPRIGDAKDVEFRIGVDNVFDRYFQRHLSSLPAEGRTFKLSFANTCPFCVHELQSWAAASPALEHGGGRLIVVAAETGEGASAIQDMIGPGATLLCDVDHGAALACGLAFPVGEEMKRRYLAIGLDLAATYGSDGGFLPIPATFVVGEDGIIRLAHVDADFRLRPDPLDVVAFLAAMR